MANDSHLPPDHDDAKRAAACEVRPGISAGKPVNRLAFLDGLRGFAALGIAVYHIWRYEPAPDNAVAVVPRFVEWMLLKSWVGVQCLLVISGFVIALTLKDTWVTPREAASFIARRIVRLAPAYWLTIFLVVMVQFACSAWWKLPVPFEDPVTFGRVLAHLLFLQDVLSYTPMSAGIWTVCIEMQFYIVCVLGYGLAQRIVPRPNPQQPRTSGAGLLTIFAPLALAALLHWNRQSETESWVIHFLNAFFLGMMTCWALDRTISPRVFGSIVTVFVGHIALQWYFTSRAQVDPAVVVPLALEWRVENLLTLGVAIAIYTAGRTGHFHDWLNWRWLQYLGRISYSLYLIHYPVSHFLTWWCWRWCANSPTPIQASLILLGCLIASIGTGHCLYVGAEAPSGRWSAKLKARWPS